MFPPPTTMPICTPSAWTSASSAARSAASSRVDAEAARRARERLAAQLEDDAPVSEVGPRGGRRDRPAVVQEVALSRHVAPSTRAPHRAQSRPRPAAQRLATRDVGEGRAPVVLPAHVRSFAHRSGPHRRRALAARVPASRARSVQRQGARSPRPTSTAASGSRRRSARSRRAGAREGGLAHHHAGRLRRRDRAHGPVRSPPIPVAGAARELLAEMVEHPAPRR